MQLHRESRVGIGPAIGKGVRSVRCVCAKARSCRERVFCRPTLAFPEHYRMAADDSDAPVEIPITGELDLHTFAPAEIPDLLDTYLSECVRRGLTSARIIHGKGTGTLRALVQARLQRSPLVAEFVTGDEHRGGWGATIVTLKRGISC